MKQKLLLLAALVWEPVRRLIRNEEPAIAASGAAIVINLLAHYNMHLTSGQTTWLNALLLGFIGKLVREQVVPVAKLPDATSTMTHLWYILQEQVIDQAKPKKKAKN